MRRYVGHSIKRQPQQCQCLHDRVYLETAREHRQLITAATLYVPTARAETLVALGQQSSVDNQVGARDVARLFGGQKYGGVGHILWECKSL
jgi:hypothetical protein